MSGIEIVLVAMVTLQAMVCLLLIRAAAWTHTRLTALESMRPAIKEND